ncbi:hypothetical protein [Marivita sp. S2033]|uniref:hypothetical protein n=1 Tax=Marivita sp. S2033 TaxID=3373187 RepID=UPI0039823B80
MTQKNTPNAGHSAAEALAILDEAWAYYRPEPKLVSAQNGAPSPVIAEYYAA